jgi:RNA polymerase sigma-70 factor (ECF subfamily)
MGWSPGWSRAAPPGRCAGPGTPADAALVAAAQADPRAFVALYERYVGRIYGYCHARLGDREAAEDATSEVFTRALAALGRYRDVLFAAWIFRIAHNVVVDAQRRPGAPLAASADHPDPARGPDEAAIATSERAAVQRARAALPDDERAAIELARAGWSGEAIAAQLGRSPTAVKQLRYRAMGRLRASLTRAGHAPEEARDA